ncbi:MAG: flagellar biosynthetic protein FliP [Planctomycetota bacterium]|nr:MAG: flagellar biosynthetic protein FliP [Planctomycetota bacterium]
MSDWTGWIPASWLGPAGVGSSVQVMLAFSIIGLLPSIFLLTTCWMRFAIVLGLLRQALGGSQYLPNQVITGLGLMLTIAVMAPVWETAYHDGIETYQRTSYPDLDAQRAGLRDAVQRGMDPLKRFMVQQLQAAGNERNVSLFLRSRDSQGQGAAPQYFEDLPLSVLLPAFVLSELQVAFLIGLQILLPFLVIDLVVSSLLTGMGLSTLPPLWVSLPLKLLVFVSIDGWALTVRMLLQSVSV